MSQASRWGVGPGRGALRLTSLSPRPGKTGAVIGGHTRLCDDSGASIAADSGCGSDKHLNLDGKDGPGLGRSLGMASA